MSAAIGQPYNGSFKIDVSNLNGRLIDLNRGKGQHLRTEKEGIDEAVHELADSVPSMGGQVGITKEVYDRFAGNTALIADIRAARVGIDKLAEVLKESEAKYTHDRENDLSIMVDAVKSTVNRTGNTALLAGFEKTIWYNAQTAEKAAKTRKKNASKKGPGDPKE